MNRNRIGVAAMLAAMVLGGASLCVSNHGHTLKLDSSSPHIEQFAGAIDGNVNEVSYDNANRVYAMIVLPTNYMSDRRSQEVMQAFSTDQQIRSTAIVKVHVADSDFCYRWGNAFPEAQQGTPTICILQETGDQARSVYKSPIGPNSNISSELASCQSALRSLRVNGNCPVCPKPRPDRPDPRPLIGPHQPSLPPLPNTPGPNMPQPLSEDQTVGLILIAIVGGLGGLVAYFRQD